MNRDPAWRLLDEAPGPGALSHLRQAGFVYPERAAQELRVLGSDPAARAVLGSLLDPLLGALAEAPDPDAALGRLERLARAARGHLALFPLLQSRGADGLRALSWALGASSFTAEALVRHPGWLPWVLDPGTLTVARSEEAMAADASREIGVRPPEAAGDALRIARRRELLVIALRDLLRLASVEQTLASLTRLADALLPIALGVAEQEVRQRLGVPHRRGHATRGFSVLALGKLGASELNFSSDVDLVYLHGSEAGVLSRRPGAPSRRAYLDLLAQRLTAVLGEATHEGVVFRVDLRLRPEGRAGAISHSLRSALEYYRTRGATWERLALLKARPVAGDVRLSGPFLERVSTFVWGRPFGAEAVRQVVHMKQETDRRLAARGLSRRHVKLGRGGIRELELVAQVLQLRQGCGEERPLAGYARPTLEVLRALRASRVLSVSEHASLERAYRFLRDLENKLQLAHDTQTHVLPVDEGEQRLLARRLGYQGEPEQALALFRSDLARHTEAVHLVYTERLAREISAESAR